MTALIPTLVVAATVAALTLLLVQVIPTRREHARFRTDRLGLGAPVAAEPDPGLAGRLDRAFAALVVRSGLKLGAGQASALILLSAVGAAVGLAVAGRMLWLAVPGFIAGTALPLVGLVVLQGRWRRQLQAQVPDILSLIARSLRAGMSLEQAIALSGQYGPSPLAQEFRHLSERISLGLPLRHALRTMAARLRLSDLDVLLSVLTLQGSVGGNLPMLLDRVAAGARDRNQFRGHVQAATAMSRTSGTFVALGQPLLLLIYMIWQPEMFAKFFDTPTGIYALGLSFALEIVGVIWIVLLLRIDY